IGVKGKMFTPHLMKEIRPVRAVGEEGSPSYRAARNSFVYNNPEPKIVPMTAEQEEVVVKGMWGVVNDGGTAAGIRIPGFDIAGKTGTAQVAELVKDVGSKRDHAWFVSFAPAYKPEIAVLALIENVGFGGSFAAPAAQGVYLEYLKKTGRSQAADAASTDSKKIIDGEEIEAQSQPQKKKVRL
ncbi:MAG: penicillin-binding transpeptidase domain-containing protein, partial [Acidobacteriota bacterium]